VQEEITPLAGRGERLNKVAGQVFTWSGINRESRGGGVVFLCCRGDSVVGEAGGEEHYVVNCQLMRGESDVEE
jgi:hypothetical protein